MGNQLNQMLAQAWLAIDQQLHNTVAKREQRNIWRELRAINHALYQQQLAVEEERGQWNSTGQTIGCVVGGTIGLIASGGNPLAAAKGCSTGGQVVGTVTDWIYDGTDWDTAAEKELQSLEAELDSFDFSLSDYATKYGIQDKLDWELDVENNHMSMMEDFDKWESNFYSQTGADYMLELGTIGLEFAASEVGGEIISDVGDWWAEETLDKTIIDSIETTPIDTDVLDVEYDSTTYDWA